MDHLSQDGQEINMMISKENLPTDFEYPHEFQKIVELKIVTFNPWYLLEDDRAQRILEGLKRRYHSRVLIPFAKRDDNDDISCFEVGGSHSISIIHDFASAGFENRMTFDSFWDWFRFAIEEMINFE